MQKQPSNLNKVRIDKWLWSVRIFKSRTLASDACRENRVQINGRPVKPSDNVQKGDSLQVKKDGFNLTLKVVELIDKRVSAALAEPCYENLTPAAELNKFNARYLEGGVLEVRDRGTGRPTKRERREIDDFKEVRPFGMLAEESEDWPWAEEENDEDED